MKELFEKGLLAGLGMLAITKDEAKSILNKLVEKGSLSAEEAESAAKEFARQGKAAAKSLDNTFSEIVQTVLDKSPFVRKTEFEKLQKRLEKLEKELKKKKTPVKRAAKK